MSKQQRIRWRLALAETAAQIMTEESREEWAIARGKAIKRLNLPDRGAHLPSKSEIEAALAARLHLFSGPSHTRWHSRQLAVAVELMQLLLEFRPALVGSVLTGTSNTHSTVRLHAFTDATTQVAIKLIDHQVPYQESETWVIGINHAIPRFSFVVDDTPASVDVFSLAAERQIPVSTRDGALQQRARLAEVKQLLQRVSD